jgi:UDP-N-acetylglucosamine/UDP-N-acetylgalactosamine diphosphorylase
MDDSSTYREVRQKAAAHGQGHSFAFWDGLSDDERHTLVGQVQLIDFELIEQLFRNVGNTNRFAALTQNAQPPQAIRLVDKHDQISVDKALAAGEQALRRGEVGAILVAGGQGSRLGFNHPKGMYPIGPVSQASLFQILFEKLLAVGRRYGVAIPIYLMTSSTTHEETADYLQANRNFGLSSENVSLFCQGVMPAVDSASGKILLAGKGEVALSPDGHGGMLAALVRSGGLADIERRGLKHLFYFQVDNPLVEMCDPLFLGHHILAHSEASTLAIAKTDPLERVGNIVQLDGRTQIIEYSDLPAEVAGQRNADSSLCFWAGNTAVHAFAVEFLNRVSPDQLQLPFHIALKKVPYIDGQGCSVEPAEPNAFKFERFIFDLLPAAERAIVVETDARRTFAPVKNPPGAAKDSPDTCRAAMMALHREWLTAAGAKIDSNVPVEVSPLFALDEKELRTKVDSKTIAHRPTYFAAEHRATGGGEPANKVSRS